MYGGFVPRPSRDMSPLQMALNQGDKSPMLGLASIIARIKQKLEEQKLSARSVSIEAGVGEEFLKDLFAGKNKKPSAMALAHVARALGTTSSWLLEGRDEADTEPSTIPVEFYIGAGAMVAAFDDQWPLEWAAVPPGDTSVKGAAIVRGTSQLPALRDGDIVFWGEGSSDPSIFLGLECVCTLADGRQLVKRIIAGSRRGLYTLLSHNDDPILDVQIAVAAPVLWVKRSLHR